MSKKRKPTTDTIEILHRRYYAGRTGRIAELAEARVEDESFADADFLRSRETIVKFDDSFQNSKKQAMPYRRFPKYNRWLEFQSVDDYWKYENQVGRTSWPLNFSSGRKEFQSLIEKRSPENQIQSFLENHPYLLPGFGDLHPRPYGGIIATKFPLSTSFVTDFAYVACDSQTLHFTCVEIESARKNLFRKDGRFNRDYLDAKQQICDWLFWAKDHGREAIGAWGKLFNGKPADWYDVGFRGFLVCGRRSEVDNRVKQERWSAEASSLTQGLQTMTYDRLFKRLEGEVYSNFDTDKLVVCSFRDRRFIVKQVVC